MATVAEMVNETHATLMINGSSLKSIRYIISIQQTSKKSHIHVPGPAASFICNVKMAISPWTKTENTSDYHKH